MRATWTWRGGVRLRGADESGDGVGVGSDTAFLQIELTHHAVLYNTTSKTPATPFDSARNSTQRQAST